MKKSLVFIHDSLPTEGISGRIIFLRHFLELKDWDIHIIIPEYAFIQEVVDSYPENFFVHIFYLRKPYWPPFSWSFTPLVWFRNILWANEIKKLLKEISPAVVIGVLSSVFSIAASYYSKQLNIRFVVFIHDNWLNSVKKNKKAIKKYANSVLNSAEQILPVTVDLVTYFNRTLLKKTDVLLPIPSGHAGKAKWKEEMKSSISLLHVGTVNHHTPYIFDFLLNKVLDINDQLSAIYYDHPILQPFLSYNNFKRIDFFDTSSQALDYAVNKCSVLVIYYGLTLEENPYALDSFPSRFIEFAHTGIPIICIAPQESSFYKFLEKKKWPLLFSKTNIEEISKYKELLKTKAFWETSANSTCDLVKREFLPSNIHDIFLKAINSDQKLT